MSIHISRDNPMRPPDWRWKRALGILDGTQPGPSRRADGHQGFSWIKRIMRFKRAWDECESNLDFRTLANRTPDLFWAHEAWRHEQQQMRWDIEAMILARADDYEIGFAAGCPAEVVKAFENVFFNVREKLLHRRYIIHCVIGPAIHRGLSEREYDLLWKLFGYFYGPHVLEALTTKMVNPLWCSTPDTVNSTLQDDAISTMKFKSAVAAKTIPVNNSTQMDLLNVFTKFVEVERTTDSIGKSQNQILDHIEAMMISLPFNVSGHDPRSGDPAPITPMGRFKTTSVELSFQETMAVAAGQQLPDEGELKNLTFPERPMILEVEAGGSNEKAE